MRHLKLSFLFIVLMNMIGPKAFPHDIEVQNADGVTIYYVWANSNTELSVSYRGSYSSAYSNEYSGNIVIPESVIYNETTYPVTSIDGYAFSDCSELTSIAFPKSVTSIGNYAFSGCHALTSVNITDLVSWCNISFGAYDSNPLCYAHRLFLKGEEVKDLVIPNTVTAIGHSVFKDCYSLTSVTIPNSVTSIGKSAFSNCSSLTSIAIPNSVTNIGSSAFYGCTGLTSVAIPISLTSINDYLFYGCSSLTNVTIPNSVTSIGQSAFAGCSSLASVIVPNSVESIGQSTFYGCAELKSIKLSNSLTSIGSNAFSYCKNLTSISLPAGIIRIEDYTFSNCANLSSFTCQDNITYLGQYAFSGCSGLKEFTLPAQLVTISNQAFYGCSGLTSIFIPALVSSIGSGIFAGCTSLTTISVDKNNSTYCSLDGVLMDKNQTTIVAFPDAKESYVLPTSVTSLNPGLLGTNLKSFHISDSDTPLTLTNGKFPNIENIYIGRNITLSSSSNYYYPFSGVETESVVFGNKVNDIAGKLFSSSYLKSVTIPSSITTINSNAFASCSRLETVNYLGTINQWLRISFSNNPLHNGAEFYLNGSSISDVTFANIDGTVGTQLQGCTNLKSVTIASGNTIVAENAFRGCSSMERVTIPNSMSTINKDAFYGCEKMHTVYYNGTISDWYAMTLTHNPLSFGADLYLNNTLLTNANIPSTITTLDTHLRGCTSLKTLNIPSGVTSIGSNAFDGCSSLASVSIPYGVTSIASRAFGSCTSLTSITIPSSVTNLSNFAFSGCTALQDINFSGSENYTTIDGVVYDKDVTRIITYPQAKTSTTYTYPSSITDFSGISNNPYLKKIYVPKLSNTPNIYYYTFNAGDNLEAVEFADAVGDYYTKDGVVYLKAEYNGEAKNTLVFCPRGKTSLTVPVDVLYIQVDGFRSKSKLESLVISPSERGLHFYCNSNSSSSSEGAFHSPLKILYLGRQVFFDKYNSYTLYNRDVFARNPSLETAVVGENVTAIPYSLFEGCTALSLITLPETIQSVGSNAFAGTPWLASLPMFDGVRYYKNIALQYEYSEETKNVRLKEGSSVIAGGLFSESSVESVAFPVSVTTLESSLFSGCSSLKKIVLPNSITKIPSNMGSGAVEYFHVPGSVTWIGRYAINNCGTVVIEDGNTSLTLQDRNAKDGYWDGVFSGVKKLYVGRNTDCDGYSYAGQAFTALNSSNTQLTDITFGPLVTSAFTGYDFRYCDKVTNVSCLAKEPFSSPDFYQIPQTAVLNVPLGSKQLYESAQGWSNFKSIQEVTEVTITLDDTEMVYAGDFDLDFSQVSGLQAFIAGDYSAGASTIVFDRVQKVPAGKGVILKGTKGTYTVPCVNIEPMMADPLCGTISGRFIRDVQDENVNLYFDKVEHVFKPVDAVYGCQLSRNEAYLSLPASSISGYGGIITPQFKTYKIGDASGDGKVDMNDALYILNYLLGNPSADFNAAAADTNKDGVVDIADAVHIVNYITGKITTLAPQTETSPQAHQ